MTTQNHQSATGEELSPGTFAPQSLAPTLIVSTSSTGIRVEPNGAASDPKELEIKLKFGEETHQYVRDYIKQADQKAAFFFAGATALIAYLNSLGFISLWIISPKAWGITHILSFASTMGLVIGSLFCALTIMPRLSGTKRGVIFFNAVREYGSAPEYSEDMLSRTIGQLCDAKYRHIYELSTVCRQKYTSITYGFRFGLAGVVSTFMLLVLK